MRTNQAGQSLICIVVNGDKLPHEEELVHSMRRAVPDAAGVVLGINTARSNVILGDRYRTLWGKDTLTDTLCGHQFRLSIPSFYQVNREQAEVLYRRAVDYAGLTGAELVLDLYCGAGTITLTMADRAKKLIGAEIVPPAVKNARENARANGISNVEFFCGDASDIAVKLAADDLRPDVICVDPPRKGLAPEVIDAMVRMGPQRIVYVSCDPATLGRDVKLLEQRGYVGYSGSYDLWQYSSTGQVAGVEGNVDLDYSSKNFLPLLQETGLNGYGTGRPAMQALSGKALQVTSARCEYFYSPNVDDVAGYLPLGTYPALELSEGEWRWYVWVTFRYEEQVFWAVLLEDRSRLIDAPQADCTACEEALEQLRHRVETALELMEQALDALEEA